MFSPNQEGASVVQVFGYRHRTSTCRNGKNNNLISRNISWEHIVRAGEYRSTGLRGFCCMQGVPPFERYVRSRVSVQGLEETLTQP